MTGAGTRAREKFHEAMEKIAVGAKLARRRIAWTVESQKHVETGVYLTLKHGRRRVRAYVSICLSGPVLWEAGLRHVAMAPTQMELSLKGAEA